MVFGSLLALWVLVFVGFTPVVHADSLYLYELIEEALRENPSLQAMEHRVAAFEARIPQVGALDDPVVRIGFSNLPMHRLDFGSTPMTSKNVGVTQVLPPPGLRGARTSIASHAAGESRERLRERRDEIVYRLKETYYDLAFLDRVIFLSRENMGLLNEIGQIADIHYAKGSGSQAASLRALISRGMVEDQILTFEASRRAQAARLNTILNRNPDSQVDEALPPSTHLILPSLEELERAALEQRSILKAIDQAKSRWGAEAEAARRQSWPSLSLHLEYNQRAAVVGDPVSGDDFLTAHAAFSIPLYKGRKQKQKVLEAKARQREQEQEKEWEEANIVQAIREVTARLRQHDQQHTLFKERILPQSDLALASAISAYRVGKADMDDVLEAQAHLLKSEMMEFHHLISHAKFGAQLERIVGTRLPRTPESSPVGTGGGGH